MSSNEAVDFDSYLSQKSAEITENLKTTIEDLITDAPDIIVEAINYSLFAGGKRIRPILTLEAAKTVTGKDGSLVIPLSEAVEMIHTYSLIHDDLPAMDDAEYRRGKKTSHQVYGEDTAVLAGDSLLNLAMERALQGVPEKDNQNYLEAVKLLFYNSGINGMIGGQVVDTVKQARGSKQDNINYIESHKTGALISAAILCGCIPYLGTSNTVVQSFYNYSRIIGQIYQIVDDILDQTSNLEELGKDVGIDNRNDTRSFLSEYSLSEARLKVNELKQQAYQELNDLKELPGDFEFWYALTDYLCKRTN